MNVKTIAALAIMTAFGFNAAASAQQSPMPSAKQSPMPSLMTTPIGTFSEIDGDHAVGNTAAPLTMIIYASVTCPHCAHWFSDVWPKLKADYVEPGKLRVVFREFPTEPQDFAIAGFSLANCAPNVDYFKSIEYQMENQDEIFAGYKAGKVIETLMVTAKVSGLTTEEELRACFDEDATITRINKSMGLARASKLTGVPAFIVGGKMYKGKPEWTPLRAHLNTLYE